jgi:hypothetical protein
MADPSTGPVDEPDIAGALGVEDGPGWSGPAARPTPAAIGEVDPVDDPGKYKDVEKEIVAMLLLGVGGIGNALAAKRLGTSTFLTPDEADALAEPITNMINRRAKLKAMAAQGDLVDAVSIALTTVGITVRNLGEIAETGRQRREAIEQAHAAASEVH